MSGLEANLRVLTDHLTELAGRHDATAGRILAAKEAVSELSADMWRTHGVACAASNIAASNAETLRAAAVKKRYEVAADLRDRLNWAATNYNDADWRAAKDIRGCAV